MSTKTSKSRAEVNATILKSLLKLPGNKYCCDCKTADHPRWASWNLGIFLCIRCSGIHRSMGTHISRVKSVDLDAWTDEQTQSMVNWGNKKANSYWEGKLDENHVPSESKIDNFVKTKYVSRRWTSQETRPDPNDLEDDEAVPVAATQSTKTSEPATRTTANAKTRTAPAPAAQKSVSQPVDSLLGMDFGAQSTPVQTSAAPAAAKPEPVPPLTAQNTNQSNLSLLSDTTPVASVQSSSTRNVNPRNDLKMSIMSLYASAPKPQQQYAQPQQQSIQSQRQTPQTQMGGQKPAKAFDDLNGLFGGMNVQAATQRIPSSSIPSQAMPQRQSTFATSTPAVAHTATTSSSANPWNSTRDDDAWGGFQSESTPTSTKPAQAQSSAFDSLYSTSDVWK